MTSIPNNVVDAAAAIDLQARDASPEDLFDKLPQPTGWRILVMPYKMERKTSGGLELPDEVIERHNLATVVARVLKMGPNCYSDTDRFGEDVQPWCREGDWVCIGRYAGSRFAFGGEGEVRIINDDEVIATVSDPDVLRHV